MPFRPEQSLLRVEVPALHTIDTRSVENLFGMVGFQRPAGPNTQRALYLLVHRSGHCFRRRHTQWKTGSD